MIKAYLKIFDLKTIKKVCHRRKTWRNNTNKVRSPSYKRISLTFYSGPLKLKKSSENVCCSFVNNKRAYGKSCITH